ncbi:hypothetical protein IACHDJAJ_00043 [Aeromonas phage vB_AdhS_TS3]|nr:hypothetical protein IACHDJAJ_00043 [Aeromonas phage vB_AdhS_TS3]
MNHNIKVALWSAVFGIFVWFSPVVAALGFEVDAIQILGKLTSYEYISKHYVIVVVCVLYSVATFLIFRKK